MVIKIQKRLFIITLMILAISALASISLSKAADPIQIESTKEPTATEPIGEALPSAQPFTPEAHFAPLERPKAQEPGILEQQKIDQVEKNRERIKEKIDIKRERSDPRDRNRVPIIYKGEQIIQDDRPYPLTLEINNIIEQQRMSRPLECEIFQ